MISKYFVAYYNNRNLLIHVKHTYFLSYLCFYPILLKTIIIYDLLQCLNILIETKV